MRYDFWGFGDMDVVLGDIRKFITDDVLSKNDVIGHAGHMQIFKNCKEINELVLKTPSSTLKKYFAIKNEIIFLINANFQDLICIILIANH